MSEILSQDEIDKLLKSFSTGDTAGLEMEVPGTKRVVNYDFANPPKFNNEQLRALRAIFDNYSRLISSFMSAYLRTTVQVEVVNAEQLIFREFSNALFNPVILGIVDFHPLNGSIILELSSNIGYSIIDRILGGPGLSLKRIRDFSEIEKILLERTIVHLLSYLPESWANVTEIKPSLERLETNAQFAQVIAPTEVGALITLNIKLGVTEGRLSFVIPQTVVEPVMEHLNTRSWYVRKRSTEGQEVYREQIELQLEKANIPVSAVVGRTFITVNDFINLQVGDIIPLDSYITSDLDVMVGNLLKFQAKPGVSRGKNAIQITSVFGKEND